MINVRPRRFLAFVGRCSSRIFPDVLANPEEYFGRKAPWLCRSTLIFPGLERHAGLSSSPPFGAPVPHLGARSNAVGADGVLTHHPGDPEEIDRSRALPGWTKPTSLALASARIPHAESGSAHAKSTANENGPVVDAPEILCIPSGGFPVSVSAQPRRFPRFSSLGVRVFRSLDSVFSLHFVPCHLGWGEPMH